MIDHWKVDGEMPKIGDIVSFYGPPSLTWWDNFLWCCFRIEHKRQKSWHKYKVIDSCTSED